MPIVFTREFEPRSSDAYRSFISKLRVPLTNGWSHTVPALIFQEKKPNSFFHMVLRTSNRSVTFRLRMDNLYLIGYQRGTKWLEFKNAAGQHLITEPGTTFLNFGGSYSELAEATRKKDFKIEDLTVGHESLVGAINELATSEEDKTRAHSLMVVIMMFCEATRLNDVQDFLGKSQNYNEGAQIKKGEAIMDKVHAWGQLSEALFLADAWPTKKFKVKGWGIPDIVKMVGIALRHCFKSLSLANTQVNVGDGQCYDGLPLVEVFSVRIRNNYTYTRQIYGTIMVTDGLRTQSIYNRSSTRPENITGSGNNLLLIGPSEAAISALGDFTIKFLLHDKAKNNKVILDQYINWNFFDFGNVYDRLISKELDIDGGFLTINYAVLRNAVAAKVEIGLSAEGKNQVSVYGSVSTSCWDNADQAKSLLFSRARDDPAVVSCGALIPVQRSLVAVPLGSTFKVMADLYEGNIHFISGDDPVTFKPKVSGEDSKTITKGNYKVNMKISWIIAF